MKTAQIEIDTMVMSDLDEMARIDGKWDAETLYKFIYELSPPPKVHVARRAKELLGFAIVQPVGEWLNIQRLGVRVLSADAVYALLLLETGRAVIGINDARRAIVKEELAGVMIVVDEFDSGGVSTLRANGFRPHRGPLLEAGLIVMVWEIMIEDQS